MATAAQATFIADERATAESLARSQMEYVKALPYEPGVTEYPQALGFDDEDYSNYSATIVVAPLYGTIDIQKITVTIEHLDKQPITLDGYKVDRDD